MSIPLHPALVHLPLGIALMLPLLTAAVGWAIWRDRLDAFAWWAVVGFAALLVGSGFVALRTGENDEEGAEPFASDAAIEHHEEAAKVFWGGTGVTFAVSVLTLVALRRRQAQRAMMAATLLSSVVVAGLGFLAGKSGGQVVWGAGGPSHALQKEPEPALRR